VAIVVVSILSSKYPDGINPTYSQRALLAMSLVASMVTGATTMVDPATKWLHLRGNALALESEIWKFRTRVGEYRGRAEQERLVEERFQAAMLAVQDKVQQSSGLKDTSFYANSTATAEGPSDGNRQTRGDPARASRARSIGMSAAHYKHGQYESPKLGDKAIGADNFHSPAPATDYLKFRLVPQMTFYQTRIPRYARRRRVFQILLLLFSIFNALLASVSDPIWTAIVASVAGAVAAWQEFNCTGKKLDRYSSAANNLANMLMWWQSLPEVDQSNMKNVEFLVEHTEELLGGERAAWLSDAQQAVKNAEKKTDDVQREGGTAKASSAQVRT